MPKTTSRKSTSEPRTEQVSIRYVFRRAQSLAGLCKYLIEVGRNALLHDHAENISIQLRRSLKGEGALDILTNGIGMNETDRSYAGCMLGYSTIGSNGTGFREAALTLALRMEIHTVHRDEPDAAWRIAIPLVTFFIEAQQGTWQGQWERIPRSESRIPPNQASGTLVTIADFRAASAKNPLEPSLYDSTERQFTEDNIRKHLLASFPPDRARCFTVGGVRLQPKPLDGFQLWKEPVAIKPGLGEVSGDIRLSETGAGNWLQISGTAAAIAFRDFHRQFREFNPELAAKIPAVFERERRLTGFIRLHVLEQFPTPDRMQLLSTFYTSPEALMVVDELVRIGEKVENGLRRYEDQPRSAVTEGVIAEFIANVHRTQDLPVGKASGGAIDTVGSDPTIEALRVLPTYILLEPWDGKGPRDRATVCVKNPMAGETFVWNDRGLGILADAQNAVATILATANEGVHLVTVRSEQYPERERTIQVTVRRLVAALPVGTFCLAPMSTQILVGQERVIRIREQGDSTGPYEWNVEPATEQGKPVVNITIQSGAREVRFTALVPGRYAITCRDKKTRLTATSKIEARASREDVDVLPTPPTTPPGGCGTLPAFPGSGTGNPNQRPSHYGTVLVFDFHDKRYQFTLRADPTLTEPFFVDPEGKRIIIADAGMGQLNDPGMRLQHVAWCAASGIQLILMDAGVLSPQDQTSCSELIGTIISSGLATLKK